MSLPSSPTFPVAILASMAAHRSSRPRRLLGLLAAAPVLRTGCLVPPGVTLETAKGEVRAPSAELARSTADHVAWTREQLHERLPGLEDIPADVWVQEKAYAGALLWMRTGSLHAFIIESGDLPNPRIHVPVATWQSSVVHELVHALLGPDWDTLPAVVEEGLCDAMSIELAKDSKRRLNLMLAATLGPDLADELGSQQVGMEQLLEHDESLDLHDDGVDFAAYAYGLGYVLVSRIEARHGLGHLHLLALRARQDGLRRIPASWLLEAADIDPHQSLLRRIEPELDEAFFAYLAESGELRRMIDQCRADGSLDARGLESVIVTYSAEGRDGALRRKLVELPGWRAWARENREFLEGA